MSGFKLDTSGAVNIVHEGPAGTWGWDMLSPFAQGYVEAMFASAEWPLAHVGSPEVGYYTERGPGFSDLSPEALALILRDCEAAERVWPRDHLGGSNFWRSRQAGRQVAFPALTPFLNDEGKVCLREAGE